MRHSLTKIKGLVEDSIGVKHLLLESDVVIRLIGEVADVMAQAFRSDKKILFCGNGGSAADAQHLAAELSGRFYRDRDPLFAEALHVNASYLTAVANDYSFEQIYSRQVMAKGRAGDVLIGISTSGSSANIIRALETARRSGLVTVGLSGMSGGQMAQSSDYLIKVPSTDTPRIQECHILIGHILCQLTEETLFDAD